MAADRNTDRIRQDYNALIVLVVLLLVFGSLLMFFGSQAVRNEIKLRRTGATTQADVHDWQISMDQTTLHEIKYSFAVPGSDERFYPGDAEIGRKDLWITVAPEAWETSRQTRQIEIQYVPDDPRINYPVASGNRLWFDKIAVIVVGALMALAGCYLLLRGRARYRMYCRNPPTGDHDFRAEPENPGQPRSIIHPRES